VARGALIVGSLVAGGLFGASVVLVVGQRDQEPGGNVGSISAAAVAPSGAGYPPVESVPLARRGLPQVRPRENQPEPPLEGAPVGAILDEREAERAEWSQKLDEFERESRNPLWAPRAEDRIDDRLSSIAEASDARISAVDCRSTRCRVGLSWSEDEKDVPQRSMDVLHRSHEAMNCARTIQVSDDRKTSDLIFDCSSNPAGALVEDSEP
jgi:hypothetical protein